MASKYGQDRFKESRGVCTVRERERKEGERKWMDELRKSSVLQPASKKESHT